MRWVVPTAAVALGLGGCLATSGLFHARDITGMRVELQPGAEVEIPLRLEAPADGRAELLVEASVAAHGLEPPPEVSVVLHPGSGQVETDPTNPLRLRCVGDCRGEHRLVLSLPPNAPLPVTIEWSIHARVDTDGSWSRDQLMLEARSVDAVGDRQVVFDSESARLPGRGATVRLHLTGPADPAGLLWLEVPMTSMAPHVAPVVISDSSHLLSPQPGTSTPLTPPRWCGPRLCDWSLVVAAVGPWRVAATSSEFDVSVTPLDEGALAGHARWRETIGAGEVIQLDLDITTPVIHSTSVALDVEVILWSVVPGGSASEPTTVGFGPHRSVHDRRTSQVPEVLIPISCDVDECRGSTPVLIDAGSHDADLDIELSVRAGLAAPPPVAGQIHLELHP